MIEEAELISSFIPFRKW